MKVLGIFLIIVFITLLAMKMIEYFRQIKLHHKQVAQMDELIIELKAKQKALNERAKIIRNSEKFQKDRLAVIYSCLSVIIGKSQLSD